jgi:spermidine synthase
MIPWETLDTATVPGESEQLRLKRRGTEFSIMLGQNELMNSRLSGSEQALATLACEQIRAVDNPRILIGGLGMGFTLRAALDSLGSRGCIEVAELVPAVVRWAKTEMVDIFGQSLADSRVSIRETDVGAVIREARSTFDAILLDVDNGPEGLTRQANDALYNSSGLAIARTALRPRGVLAVWSVNPDAKFSRLLRKSGFEVTEHRVRAHARRGARHIIWIATRSADQKL